MTRTGQPDAPRPRVLQVITHLAMGGAEGVAMSLIDQLRKDCDFTLFAVLNDGAGGAVGQDMRKRLDAWQVPVRHGCAGRFKSGGVVLAALRLARTIRKRRIDVVHVHTEIPELTHAVACTLSAGARRTPLIRTVHNTELWIDWHAIGRRVTQRLSHGEAVAVSRSAAEADAAIATRSARPPAQVVYNGVHPPPRRDRSGASPFRLLFAGRLVHQKGADLLPAILATAHARTARRDVELTIAGTGVMRDEVERGLVDALSGWTVRIVPPIERLAEALSTYDAVLLPSRFEGFALLPLEVLMAGVPLVTTDAPGLNEAIAPDYPFQAHVDDVEAIAAKLVRVIEDPAAARTIAGAAGDALAKRFGPEAMARAYLLRYRALAGNGAGVG
ncbi:glycosyltransferase family 4 protein [Sphingomonas sp. Y38-1Y]|uniref:glycosyltransferase family 4 protein n=1 Tax=Sphingomonas sp. Y38-1Y TaxID=3078265 RepID=UPI0028E8B83C|nr:glycosyltransferase family 4 protein [Sphingomonas sp. Y38-1Y]